MRLAATALAVLLAFHSVSATPNLDPALIDAARLIREHAAEHRLILLGELHGTREIPELVGELVRQIAAREPVLLGLEVHASDQAAIDRYLASSGDRKAREAVRSAPFWNAHNTQHDGRRSYDMLDLIETVRVLRHQGRNVQILAYDNPKAMREESEQRDEHMATRIRAALQNLPKGRFVVLAGNVHAMLQRPSYAPSEMQSPMASYLRDLDPYSINITARAGEFWACMAHCGPVALPTLDQRSGPQSDGTYNFQVVLPRLTVARLIGSPAPQSR